MFERLHRIINEESGKRNIGLKRDLGIQEPIDINTLKEKDPILLQKILLPLYLLKFFEDITVYKIQEYAYLIESIDGSYIVRTSPKVFTKSEKEKIQELNRLSQICYVDNNPRELEYIKYHENIELGIKSTYSCICKGKIDCDDKKELITVCFELVNENIN